MIDMHAHWRPQCSPTPPRCSRRSHGSRSANRPRLGRSMSVHTSPRRTWRQGFPTSGAVWKTYGYMTCMTLTLLGNYAQTGHFGGPLAYTPFNVAGRTWPGPSWAGFRYDYRHPKHPYGDKFMLGGTLRTHLLRAVDDPGPALYRKHHATGDPRYHVAPDVAMLPVDALGFRRGAGALRTLLADQGLSDHPLFARPRGEASGRCPGTSSPPISPRRLSRGRRGSRRPEAAVDVVVRSVTRCARTAPGCLAPWPGRTADGPTALVREQRPQRAGAAAESQARRPAASRTSGAT